MAWLLALPFLFILSKIKSKYKHSLPARFWLSNNKPLQEDGIWIHVCSFGEAKAIDSLIKSIPKDMLRLTASTQTGFSEISKHTTQSRYLPFEPLLPFWIKKQKMVIVMEAELWYMLFAVASSKGAKTLLINARMNDKSFPKYKKMRWLYRRIFEKIDMVYAQSEIDKIRLEELGAKNVIVNGNIKFASITKKTKDFIKPNGLLVCGASTHDKEEAMILSAFRSLKSKKPDSKIVVVPRHPERFETVSHMMASMGQLNNYTFNKWSDKQNFSSDLTLFDSMGELVNIYAISDIVVLGGAFESHGGHNAAEAAQFGCKLITGENYYNQKEIFGGIRKLYIVKNEDLTEVLHYPNLLEQSSLIGRGNTDLIIQDIKDIISKK